MIQIEHLSKHFKTDTGVLAALNDISLTLKTGDCVGIIGMSGAGKTTLLRCLSLLEKPDQGRLVIDGLNLLEAQDDRMRAYRQRIGVVFQSNPLLKQRTVFENVAFPLRLQKADPKLIETRVKELLNLVHLGDKANAYPTQLSGGQKQRVSIARALATQPDLLLFDEPTSALDPITTRSLLDLIAEIHAKLKTTILIITHEMSVVETVCSEVHVLNEGQLVESGKVAEVFSHPTHATTKLLLGRDA